MKKYKNVVLINIVGFGLISLKLIRWEGALSQVIEIALGALWAGSGHKIVGICKFWGLCFWFWIKLWSQEEVGMAMANLPASGQGGAKGRGVG